MLLFPRGPLLHCLPLWIKRPIGGRAPIRNLVASCIQELLSVGPRCREARVKGCPSEGSPERGVASHAEADLPASPCAPPRGLPPFGVKVSLSIPRVSVHPAEHLLPRHASGAVHSWITCFLGVLSRSKMSCQGGMLCHALPELPALCCRERHRRRAPISQRQRRSGLGQEQRRCGRAGRR